MAENIQTYQGCSSTCDPIESCREQHQMTIDQCFTHSQGNGSSMSKVDEETNDLIHLSWKHNPNCEPRDKPSYKDDLGTLY